jgi:hypothetical protein
LPPAFADFLLDLLFDLNDKGDIFLRNVWISSSYLLLQPEVCTFHASLLFGKENSSYTECSRENMSTLKMK